MSSFDEIRAGLLKKYNVSPSGGTGSTQKDGSGSQSASPDNSEFYAIRKNLLDKYSDEKVEQRRNTVSDWSKRYSNVINGISSESAKSGNWYTRQAIDRYGSEIASLVREYGSIKDYADRSGLPNAFRYAKQLQDIQKAIQKEDSWYQKYRGSGIEDVDSFLANMGEGEERDWLTANRYEVYKSNSDFGDLSQSGLERYEADQAAQSSSQEQKKSFGDILVKALSGAGNPGSNSMAEASFQLASDKRYQQPREDWTDEQRSIYGYLYAQNKEKAAAYAQEVNDAYNAKVQDAEVQKTAEFATQHPVLSTAGSIAGNAAGFGMADLTATMLEKIARGTITQKDYLTPHQYTETATGAISQNLNDRYGTLNEKIPVLGGKGLGDAYQIANSFATSMATAHTVGMATDVIFFGNAAASMIYDAKGRGATDDQAIAMGLIAGAAEAMGEHFSVSHLLGLENSETVKPFLKSILSQSFVEGEEEVFTSFINNLADYWIMGDKSQFKTLITEYLEENPDADDKEALKYALMQMGADMAFDFLGGAVSGGAGGVVASAVNNYAWNQYYHDTYGPSQRELVQEAMEIDPDRKVAQKANQRLDSGKNLSGRQIRQIVESNDQVAMEQAVKQRLNEMGETGDADTISRAITKQARSEELTWAEKQAMKNSSIGDVVAREMASGEIWERTQRKSPTAANLETISKRYGEQAPYFIRNYIEGQNVMEYALGFSAAYEMGRQGGKRENLSSNVPYLSESQKEIAYDIGRDAARATSASEQKTTSEGETVLKDTGEAAAEYETSADGKTILKDTGETVQIQKVSQTGKDGVKLLLSDGREVDAGQIAYSSQEESVLYSGITGLGVDAEGANKLLEAYQQSAGNVAGAAANTVRAEDYVQGVEQAFHMGQVNAPAAELESGNGALMQLSKQQRETAYSLGKQTAKDKTSREDATVKSRSKNRNGKKQGKVHFDATGKQLNEQQQTALKVMDMLSATLGVDFYVFESHENAQGQRVYNVNGVERSINGWYDLEDGSIHIDLNAGIGGKGTMLFTVAHELTHFVRQWSPKKFRVLADFLTEQYGENGLSLYAQVEKRQEKTGLSFAEAYEEVVADSMEAMLNDGNVVQQIAELKQRDQSLWEKIKGWFQNLAEDLKAVVKAYSGAKPNSPEGRAVAAMEDTITVLESLYTDALLDAGENYQASNESESVALEGGEDRYSERDFSEQVDEVLSGTFDRTNALYMGNTPKILSSVGLNGDLPMLTTAKHIRNATLSQNDKLHHHGLSVDQVKQLPEKIADPVMIMDTFDSSRNSIVIVTDMLNADGVPVIAVVKADGKGMYNNVEIDANFVTSYYGKNGFANFVRKNVEADNILYVNKKKATVLSTESGTQWLEQLKNYDFDTIIRKARVNVKENGGQNSQNGNEKSRKVDLNSVEGVLFQERNEDLEKANQVLEQQNVKLKEDVSRLKELLKLQKSLTGGTRFTEDSVAKVTRDLMKQNNAIGDRKELSGLLNNLYAYIAREKELTWEGVSKAAEPAARWIADHQKVKPSQYAKDILREVRGSRVYLDETQKKEAAYQFGSFSEYRKRTFGSIILTENNSVSLDTKWQELSNLYPNIFNPDTASTDMPREFLDVMERLRSMTDMDVHAYDRDMMIQDYIRQVYDSYWDVSTLRTVADKKQKQIDLLKAEHSRKMQELRNDHRESTKKLKQDYQKKMDEMRENARKDRKKKRQIIHDLWVDSREKGVEASWELFLSSKDAEAIDKEFIKFVREFDKQNKKNANADINLMEKEFRRLSKIYDRDIGTMEREFNRIQKEYEKADRNIDRLQSSLEKQRNVAKEKVESRKCTFIRNQIKGMADKFHKMATAPAKAKTLHAPVHLTNAVAQFCDIFAESQEFGLKVEAGRLNTRKAALDAGKAALDKDVSYDEAHAKKAASLEQEAGIIERKDARIAKTAERLKAMREQYADIKGDSVLGMFYDEHTAGLIEELSKELSGTDIYEMNSDQLKNVYNTMQSMMNVIVNANKVFSMGKDKTLIGVVKKMSDEISQVNIKTDKASIALRRYMMWQMSPDTFFDYLCGYIKDNEGKAVQKMFSDGTERMLRVQRDFYNMFQHLTETKNKQDAKALRNMMSNPTKTMVDWGLKDAAGNPVKTSKGMMLQAYMLLMQEDSLDSLAYGGFKLPRAKEYYKGNIDAAYGDSAESSLLSSAIGEDISELVHQINSLQKELSAEGIRAEDSEEIRKQVKDLEQRRDTLVEGEKARLLEMREAIGKSLTPLEKDLVNTASEWYRYTGKLMSEVFEKMYGYRPNLVENYVPIHRDLTTVKTDIRETEDAFNLENSGFTKERVKSRAPILLTDFFTELANQQQKISRYYGFAQVQKDFNRIWNMKLPGVRSSIESKVAAKYGTGDTKLGVSGTGYIENYIKAVSGANHGNDLLSTFYGNAASSTLSFNPRVAFSQLASIPTASAVVGWKSMAAGFAKGIGTSISTKKKNELAQKSVWFFQRYRGEGGITEIADLNARGGLWSKVSSSKVGKWLFNWCQNFDVLATASMWAMAEDYVQSHGTKEGSEGYNTAVEQVYADIIRKTQPNYTTTERSDLLRDKRGGMKFLTMYKTQPNQNLNILISANGEFMRAKQDFKAGRNGVTKADVKAAGGNLANAVTSVTIGGTLTFVALRTMVNFLMFAVNPYRDDDTDEVTKEETINGMLQEMLSSLTGMFALGGQLYDVVNAVVSRDQYYGISDSAISLIAEALDTTVSTLQKVTDPEEELKWEHVVKQIGDILTVFGVPYDNIKKFANAVTSWRNDWKSGTIGQYTRESTTDNQYRARFVEAYREGDTEKCSDILAYLLAESDAPNDRRAEKELQSGFKEYLKGQFVNEKVTAQEVTDILRDYLDMDTDEITSALNQWQGIVDTGKTASQEEEAYLKHEVSSEEYIEYLTKYSGKSQEDAAAAEKKLRCERDEEIAYSDIDDLYIHGELSSSKASEYLQKYGDVSKEDAEQKILEWDFEREYEIAWSDKKEAYLDGEISYKDLRAALIRFGGKNAEDADAYMEDLDFEKKHHFAYSDRKSVYLNGGISRSELKNILINEREYDEDYAELTLDAYDWIRNHPKYDYETTTVMSYLKPLDDLGYSVEECGIPIDTFVKERKYIDSIESDKDENGDGIPYSRINKAFPYINELPLTAEQKTALAVACGWTLKTVNKKKLW